MYCVAGVSPAILAISTHRKNADETLAPQKPAYLAESPAYVPPIRIIVKNKGLESAPQNEESLLSSWPVPSGTKERSPPRERWVGVRAEGQAPKERHRGNQMCRPFGAVMDRTPCPTVSTVGYVVTSLRDFEQHKSGTPHSNIGRNFLWDRLFAKSVTKSGSGLPGASPSRRLPCNQTRGRTPACWMALR